MPSDQAPSTNPLARLPAERRQHKDGGIVLYSCCCCCCCCCLHTVGGLIGAVTAGDIRSKVRRAPADEDAELDSGEVDFEPRPRPASLPGAQGLFWSSLLIVIFLQVAITIVLVPQNFGEILMGSFCALILVGPAYFLAACVVMGFRIAANPALRENPEYFQYTLKIFGRTVIGTLIGLGIMIGPFILLK